MTFANILLGLTIGFPMMIAVGPISVLLLDQGLERGVRAAAPAVIGVASADLTLSLIASIGGAKLSQVLAPVTSWLTVGAVAVLAWLAYDLGRAALVDLRSARLATTELELVAVGGGVTLGDSIGEPAGDQSADHPGGSSAARDEAASSTFGHLSGTRLAAMFYGFTIVNPLTLVLFASLVVAGGAGIGTLGWAIGMALASLLAHGSFMVAGGVLGSRLSPTANGALRLVAAVFMAALAIHFAVGI
ncbi:MAG: LysE family transporter [Actinomycetota bacterium]|nr:LysE family transporter [Actinomycetota bacterium]